MIEIFKSSDFKIMPWKNGGGVTTEIFRLPALDADTFLFRLSKAKVATDGPFSIFPNIDRTLLLIDGHGLHLTSNERKVELNKKLSPLDFKGEEVFSCALSGGPCIDFNVMTDRRYAKSSISVIHPENDGKIFFKAECDLKFIYDISHETLYKLERGDQTDLVSLKNQPLIVIETKLI